MKKVLLPLVILLSVITTSASAGQWDGDWAVKVYSKYQFELPFKIRGSKVSVDKFGKSQATAVSEATFTGSRISFKITFKSLAGGKCGDGSTGIYTTKFGKRGKWKYNCVGIGSGSAGTGKAKNTQ